MLDPLELEREVVNELSDMSVLVQTLVLTVEQQTLCCCETGFLAMLELDL